MCTRNRFSNKPLAEARISGIASFLVFFYILNASLWLLSAEPQMYVIGICLLMSRSQLIAVQM